jgi:hypothetical protein
MKIKPYFLTFTLILMFLLSSGTVAAQQFSDYFENKTLRIDYTFSGDFSRQYIFVDELNAIPNWYGKHQRLNELPLKGNGQITVRDKETGAVIYKNSFSTLFQEWLSTDESHHISKSFENVFMVPFPKRSVDITVDLMDFHQKIVTSLTHTVDPKDILIRHIGKRDVTPYITIQQAVDTSKCIHIAYVSEGYTREEMGTFLTDAKVAMDALFAHEPFKSMRSRFNVIAVEAPSIESGVSEPGKGIWKNTAFGAHFDTFYSTRYNTTLHLKTLNDKLAGTPFEHIIILVNSSTYGGGGIYNSYTLADTHHPKFKPVVVHEFGHSFGGLGDEYAYNDAQSNMYPDDTEPWEPNLTTLHDFHGKWEKMIKKGTPTPTPESKDWKKILKRIGLFEGGGYQSKGVYRGVQDCRMKTNEVPEFCPVCQEALRKLIDFYTK